MNKTIKLFALAVAVLVNTSVFADNVTTLESFLKSFYNASIPNYVKNDAPNSLDASMYYNFKYTNVSVAIDGEMEIVEGAAEDFKRNLSLLKKSSEISLTMSLAKMNSIDVMGKTGVGSCEVSYELKKGAETMSKGKQLVSFVAISTNSGWKLSYLNTTEVENEKFIGNCVCEIYANGSGFMTELVLPDGDTYETINDKFEIKQMGQNRYIIVNGTDKYKWDETTGAITFNDESIGVAKSNNWAIILILKRMQAEKCNNVVVKE